MKNSEKKYIFDHKLFKIRETLDEDTEKWYKWFNDNKITEFVPNVRGPNTIEAQKKYRLAHINGEERAIFSVVSGKKDKLIGTCSIAFLKPANSRRCEISLIIGESKYCSGPTYIEINRWLINYSFNHFGMNSIISSTFEDNLVVRKTVEFLGFKKIGLQRSRFYKNGKFCNAAQYDLLKSEWEKNK